MNCDHRPQQKILAAMLAGCSFTVKEAWQYAGTTEMRRVVSRLKKQGYDIKTRRLPGETFIHYYIAKNQKP
jgi:hypothetical protein